MDTQGVLVALLAGLLSYILVGGLWKAILAWLSGIAIAYSRDIRIVTSTLRRDLWIITKDKKLQKCSDNLEAQNATVYRVFKTHAEGTPEKVCFYFEDDVWTYRKMELFCNRIARAFQLAGFRKGDVVALNMMNRPEYIAIWLGLSQLGVITALINYNLKEESLVHAIKSTNSKAVIFDEECAPGVLSVRDQIEPEKGFYQLGGSPGKGIADLEKVVAKESAVEPHVTEIVGFWDTVVYISTSGTTGLPNAVKIPNAKVLLLPKRCQELLSLQPEDDVVYCPLPMYHAAGGVYGVGFALFCGVPVIITRKFSVSRYWTDCIRYGATTIQYIGEMCRYLMAVPEVPEERQHRVRIAMGNGIQPAIFIPFKERFGIPDIKEFYGSTEGNVGVCNVENIPGAVGFLPRCVPRKMLPMALIRVNEDTGEPIREPNSGLCIRCEHDELGMLIGKIVPFDTSRVFVGYVDQKATEKKIIRNVFEEYDQYYSTGDLMEMDEFGNLYFKDRIGDTFRWRGENVSTLVLETVVTSALVGTSIKSAVAYGVLVPGYEGRAGMVAIADPKGEAVDHLERLGAVLRERLPRYAQPRFLRVMDDVPTTGTLKTTKSRLKKEGFDIRLVGNDPLFLWNHLTSSFEPLTKALIEDIAEGRIRL